MKAVVKYGDKAGQVELRDVPEPELRPGTVLIEVKRASVCGWDIEMWQHTMANPVTVPVIQGHEFSGVVAEAGPGVSGWKKGDAVVCETSAQVCGQCYACRTGDYQLCPERKGYGYGVDGAFTRYVIARPEILHRIPSGLSFNEAALTEPFCVVHHALHGPVKVTAGDTVLVIGPGPIGLISCQLARHMGASQVLLAGMGADRTRLALAKKQGWADRIITVEKEDPVRAVMTATNNKGADLAVDCAGNTPAFSAALESVRPGGRVVKVGWGPKPYDRSLDIILKKSLTIYGTFGHNRADWEAVPDLLAQKKLDPAGLITEVLPLNRWQEAFEKVHTAQAIKMILEPEG